MKSLNNIFHRSSLTPKERMLLIVRDDVTKDMTGEGVLTDADRESIQYGWTPVDNYQVKEYNRYLEGWHTTMYTQIDTQTLFLNIQGDHFRKQPYMLNLVYYRQFQEIRRMMKSISNTPCVTLQEAEEIARKQKTAQLESGYDFDYAVYRLALELMSEDDKKSLKELYCDIEVDQQYLKEEEVIHRLLDSKEKLAELIVEKSYNPYAKEHQLHHYFACIPLIELARSCLMSKGVDVSGLEADDEFADHSMQKALATHVVANGLVVGTLLKEACLTWMDGDLFDQYRPLCMSNCSDLLEHWISAKATAYTTITDLIQQGKLELRQASVQESKKQKLLRHPLYEREYEKMHRALEMVNMKLTSESQSRFMADEDEKCASLCDKVITGESLYAFESSWQFIKEFKERVDTYTPNLGIVYDDNDLDEKGLYLDRELVIATKDGDGKHLWASPFNLATQKLNTLTESTMIFIEIDGVLQFKKKVLEESFFIHRQDIINGYAKLLAFKELFKKLSHIFEIDVSYKLDNFIAVVGEYIDDHNEVLDMIVKPADTDTNIFQSMSSVTIDPSFYIDKEKIEPNREYLIKYEEKLKESFKSEF